MSGRGNATNETLGAINELIFILDSGATDHIVNRYIYNMNPFGASSEGFSFS